MVRYPICSSACTLSREVQLIPGLGVYSGIFAIYFQYQSNKSTGIGKKTAIVFYAICLLYVLSAVDFACDLVALISVVSNNFICSKNTIFLSVVQSKIINLPFSLGIVQPIASGCCDFLAQCILVRINHCAHHPFY